MSNNTSMKVLKRIVNQKCQGTLFIVGGTLILYLGDVLQHMSKLTSLMTAWRFWIDCAWRLYDGEKIIAGCYDDPEFICKKIGKLKDAILLDVHHDEVSHDLYFKFNNGMKLELFSDSVTDELWQLRGADGYHYGIEENLTLRESFEEPDE